MNLDDLVVDLNSIFHRMIELHFVEMLLLYVVKHNLKRKEKNYFNGIKSIFGIQLTSLEVG